MTSQLPLIGQPAKLTNSFKTQILYNTAKVHYLSNSKAETNNVTLFNTHNNSSTLPENVKNFIKYALADTNFDANDNSNPLIDANTKYQIEILKTNTSSWVHKKYTKSAIDFVAMMYIIYLCKQPEGISKLSNAFTDFPKSLKNFLIKELGMSEAIVKNIPDKYIRNIKFGDADNRTTFIKFNKLTLDVTQLLGEKTFDTIRKINVKNSEIRALVSPEEIKQRKIEAQTYFTAHINSIQNDPNIEQEKRKKLLFDLAHFIKVQDLLARAEIKTSEPYKGLIDLIPYSVALGIGLDSCEKEIEFINHCRFLNFHSNKQMIWKRIFVKPLASILLFSVIMTVTIGVLANAYSAYKNVKNAFLKYISVTGDIMEGISHSLVFIEAMDRASSNIFFNCGDGLGEYTNGAEEVFAKIANAYENISNNTNETRYTTKNYKKSEIWFNPMSKNLIKLMNSERGQETISAILKAILNRGYNDRATLRSADLFKGVDYRDYLVDNALKNAVKKIDAQNEKIDAQDKQIAELRALVNNLFIHNNNEMILTLSAEN